MKFCFQKFVIYITEKNARQIVSDSPIKPDFVTKQITVFLTRIKRFAFLFNTTLLICNHEKLLSIRIAPASNARVLHYHGARYREDKIRVTTQNRALRFRKIAGTCDIRGH